MQYCCICKIKVLVLSGKPNLLIMKKILIITAVVVIVVASCKSTDEPQMDKVAAVDMMMPNQAVREQKFVPMVVADDNDDQASRTGKLNTVEKKIIKEGEISFKTADINDTRKALYASLKKLGGYVAEERENNDSESGQKEITLQTRIPAKSFDVFLGNVSENAESIDSKNIRIKDVTTQFIDITTQLANKKKLEERYLELLKRGSKISDLLEIENKLTDIRSDIESTQGQLNYLSKQIDYSSLEVTFYSKQTVHDNGRSFGYKIKAALLDGWQILGSLFFGFIAWWPIWLVLFGGVYLSKRWFRKRRKSNN